MDTDQKERDSPVPKRKSPFINGELQESPTTSQVENEQENHRKLARKRLHDISLPSLRANECELIIDLPLMISEVDLMERDSPEKVARVERVSSSGVSGRLAFELVAFLSKSSDAGYDLGLYVRALPPPSAAGREWCMRVVSFMVMLVNAEDPFSLNSKVSTDCCTLSSADPCRGWPRIASFHSMDDLGVQGFILDESCVLARGQASFDGCEAINAPDTKRFLGLENQGATCYLNGLLQTLYHLGALKEIVYSEGEEEPSVLTALQTVFFELDENPRGAAAGSSEPLTEAFGWSSVDVSVQHDVQEMNRLLIDRLESRLTSSHVKNLFCGKIENFISCTDIDFKSSREEEFYDLQLGLVKYGPAGERIAIGSIEEALREYLAVEILEGPNAYDAGENRGKQRAEKGVRFLSLPPVLTLQLLRFQFDFETLEMGKIFSQFRFSESLELDSEVYRLYSVLVHSGGVNGGHYYAFVRPGAGGAGAGPATEQWWKFDDSSVEAVDAWCAIEKNFGGPAVDKCVNYLLSDARSPRDRGGADRQFSAYMLMYVKQSEWSDVLKPVSLDSVNPGLRPSLEERVKRIPVSRGSSGSRRVSVASTTSVTVRLLDSESASFFSKPVASLADLNDPSWFLTLPSVDRGRLNEDATVITFPGSATIGDLVDLVKTAETVFVLVGQQDKLRIAELDLTDQGMLEESLERLHATVTASRDEPIILWFMKNVVKKRESDLIFFLQKFDPNTQRVSFDRLLFLPVETALDSLTAIAKNQVAGGESEVNMFGLSSGTELVPLTDAVLDDGLVVVYQEASAEARVDAPAFFSHTLNSVSIDLFVHDLKERKWLLGGVPAEPGSLLPNRGERTEHALPTLVRVDDFDRRACMTDLAPLVADKGTLCMFAQDPFESEVKAGPNLCRSDLTVKAAIDSVGRGSRAFHCVVVPAEAPEGSRAVVVKLFSGNVVESGSCVVQCSPDQSVGQLIAQAKQSLGLAQDMPFRLVEVDPVECEICSVFKQDSHVPVSSLLCWGAANIFVNPVRIEPADEECDHLHCFHVDRSLQAPFGHPFLLSIPSDLSACGTRGERDDRLRELLSNKLEVSTSVVRSWRLSEQDGKLMITHAHNPFTHHGTPQEKQLFIKR